MKMTPEKARKLELKRREAKALFYNDVLPEPATQICDFDAGWKSAVIACTAESEDVDARLEAEREKAKESAHTQFWMVPSKSDAWRYFEESLSPVDALAEHDRKVRLEEAKWWKKQDHVHTISTDPMDLCYCEKRLAALRGKR